MNKKKQGSYMIGDRIIISPKTYNVIEDGIYDAKLTKVERNTLSNGNNLINCTFKTDEGKKGTYSIYIDDASNSVFSQLIRASFEDAPDEIDITDLKGVRVNILIRTKDIYQNIVKVASIDLDDDDDEYDLEDEDLDDEEDSEEEEEEIQNHRRQRKTKVKRENASKAGVGRSNTTRRPKREEYEELEQPYDDFLNDDNF